MMRYNLSNQFDLANFKAVVKKMEEQGGWVELKRPQEIRTNQQNKYLHLIIGWFAIEYGCGRDEAKIDFYKRAANKDIFVRELINKRGAKVVYLRSSSDLTVEEMALSITRFRDYASGVAGIYLPSANEKEFLNHIAAEIERNKEFV